MTKNRERDLSNSIKDGAAYSVAAGAGESYIAPFAVTAGASPSFIASLTSLPALAGALVQLIIPRALHAFPNRKNLVLAAVAINALSWLGIAATVFLAPEAGLPLLLAFFTVYAASNAFANTIWSSWMAALVPLELRGKFFGDRNAITQLVALVSTLVAGFALGLNPETTLTFAFLFVVSFAARTTSLLYLKKISDPAAAVPPRSEGPIAFLRNPANSDTRPAILGISLYLLVVLIAAPFFVVYQFRVLGFGYLEYTLLLIVASLARVAGMPYWGRVTNRLGNKPVLTTVAFFAVLTPFAWLATGNLFLLILLEVASGFIWAGFDLAIFNYLISATTQDRVPGVMANYNFYLNAARFAGPLLGASLIASTTILGQEGVSAALMGSGLLRIPAAFILLVALKENRILVPRRGAPAIITIDAAHPTRALTRQVHYVGNALGKFTVAGARLVRKSSYALKNRIRR
ncbi:MAG: MFS transporter [Candidatus Micrarchaeia archaeon]